MCKFGFCCLSSALPGETFGGEYPAPLLSFLLAFRFQLKAVSFTPRADKVTDRERDRDGLQIIKGNWGADRTEESRVTKSESDFTVKL